MAMAHHANSFFASLLRRRSHCTLGSLLLLLLLLQVFPVFGQTYSLLVSSASNRSGAVALESANVAGNIYVFIAPNTGISQVSFFLDDPGMTGSPRQVERKSPYDFAGTATDGTAFAFNTAQVADGSHTITALVALSGGGSETVSASFVVANNVSNNAYSLLVSSASNRSGAVALESANVAGNIYVFIAPNTGISQVSFFLDDPGMTGSPRQVERKSPYDFAGTATDGTAFAFNTDQVADGSHTITALVALSGGGSETVSASFMVANNTNNTPALVFSPNTLSFSVEEGGATTSKTTMLDTSDGSTASGVTVVENSGGWLSVTSPSGTTPDTFNVSVDASGLAPGSYTATLVASSTGYIEATADITLTVTSVEAGCAPISPLSCEEILVDLPYALDWTEDEGKITDGNDIGIGFTMVDPPSNGAGYVPSLLEMDSAAPGFLRISTTAGLAFTTSNSQDNALGVGIDAPSQISILSTTLQQIPPGTGHFEQAGLWFGTDEDNFHKLVVLSTSTGTRIQHLQELDGQVSAQANSQILNLKSTDKLILRLRVNPFDQTISGEYQLNTGAPVALGNFLAPAELFSFDAAGIDPTIGTRSFGGIFASHRNGPSSLEYSFDTFSVVGESPPSTPPSATTGNIGLTKSSYGVPNPTSMVWGADGKLYVTELFGKIHALTFNSNKQVIDDEVISILGSRLTLGITQDPNSTPGDVILWVAHSNPSTNNGQANSSTVSRILQSNPGTSGYDTLEHVIVGLPRAIANHSINSIHFGSDQRLYIALGGNTGAGAPNTANTEFGRRPEQPLSAALLVADVNAPGFMGVCGTPGCNSGPQAGCSSWVDDTNGTADNQIPDTCDVQVYSSGLRNMYDFVFHSNGNIYGPDNGLGVTGSFPPSAAPPCTGFASTTLWNNGGQNPGKQPDILLRLEQGQYYGHPNPQRDECVFKNGSFQGVSPLPNWEPPLFVLGDNLSANGIVEYPMNVGCVALKGELLIGNFSKGDNITRLKLSGDGLSVQTSSTLVGGFNDPLPLTVGPDGTIYVGEFGGNNVTALQPFSLGCWSQRQSLPQAILDAGGTALGGNLYVVGGKTSAGHQSTLYIYDPSSDVWMQGPDLPGPAVENPAVAALNGQLYVFGGSTAPFSGAVTNAAVFNPSNASWTSLASMPTARGGATAQAIGGLIYVVGGMNSSGASVNTVEVYNPATDVWSGSTPMATRRDNPGSAVLGGQLYVFGGRTRNADGTTANGTLNTVEMYNPATNTWSPRASMPTGRRTMMVGTLNGRAQVMGGEIMSNGDAFSQNEEYDPVTNTWLTLTPMSLPRHGAAAGTINGTVYVAGGGPTGGSSFTANVAAFTF